MGKRKGKRIKVLNPKRFRAEPAMSLRKAREVTSQYHKLNARLERLQQDGSKGNQGWYG